MSLENERRALKKRGEEEKRSGVFVDNLESEIKSFKINNEKKSPFLLFSSSPLLFSPLLSY
jgi:hypothetical protein